MEFHTKPGLNFILNTKLNPSNKGQLSEQFVGQELLAYQPFYEQPQLYFWMRDKASSTAEIDYLYPHKEHIIPIEVKSGSTGRLRSIKLFIEQTKSPLGVKTSIDTLSIKDNILSCPLYLLGQLERFLNDLIE